MKVCYFGSFDPDYIRNKIMIKGLRENDCMVSFCNDRSGEVKNYFRLFNKFIFTNLNCDVIVVGVLGHYDMPIAWLIAKLFRKKLVFDAFISLYDTYILDRETAKKFSLQALKFYCWDFVGCHLADKVILDTNSHKEFFVKEFHLNKEKIAVVYIGADDSVLIPESDSNQGKFTIEFHGSYQPLQGVDYIIQAANLLKEHKDIKFVLIGEGQTKKNIVKAAKNYKLNNIKFLPRKSMVEIATIINRSDICLGIFGKSEKAQRVIPNKLYEAIALNKVVITAESKAVKEVFKDKQNVILVSHRDPSQLAGSIIKLKKNRKLLNSVANNAYALFCKKFTINAVGFNFISILKKV